MRTPSSAGRQGHVIRDKGRVADRRSGSPRAVFGEEVRHSRLAASGMTPVLNERG